MDEDQAAVFGCLWIVSSIVGIIVCAIIGGTFRTDIVFTPPGIESSVLDKQKHQTVFSDQLTVRHWLGGIIKGKQADINAKISQYVRSDEKLIDIKIVTKHTWVDLIISLFTLFVYCPMTLEISGTVVDL